MFFLKLLSYLPLSVLYLLSDFLFFLAYYLVKYRREVVWKNLVISFPNKSESELRSIERKFYKNLADISVESIKLLTISENSLLDRVKLDASLTKEYQNLGYQVFGMTSHFCNWEWLLVAGSNQLGLELHAVFQRLKNSFFNNLMIKIRTRFGVILHKKNDVVKDLMRMKGSTYLMSMVADQRPFSGENKYWTVFLNQDAAFYSGTELLARRMDIKVIYTSMKRVKRGYYEGHFEEIEPAPKTAMPNEITKKFIQLVERDIENDPASYLWSHDQWKHKKPTK